MSEAISQRLRKVCVNVRTKSTPLSDFIPLLQEAADALDRPHEALLLVRDLSSQEWQSEDGKRHAATDNQGRRFWFISEDVMQEVIAAANAFAKEPA